MFDAIIIGSSLAGATAALELSRQNLRVAVLDKARAAKRKPCGEGLSEFGYQQLSELGISVPVKELGEHRIWKGGRSAPVSVGRDTRTFGVRRLVLDQVLRDIVESVAEPFWGCGVRSIEAGREDFSVSCDGERLRCRSLIIADGAHSPSARALGIRTASRGRTVYGASLVCRLTEPLDSVNIFVRRGFEMYLTPVTDDLLNLSIVGGKRAMRELLSGGALERELAELTRIIPFSPVEKIIGAGALAPIRRPPSFGRAFLAGDACHSLDPICGMGMTQAIVSGRAAGCAAAAALSGECSWNSAAQNYSDSQASLRRRLRGYSRSTQLLVRHLPGSLGLSAAEVLQLPRIFQSAALHPSGASLLLTLFGTFG